LLSTGCKRTIARFVRGCQAPIRDLCGCDSGISASGDASLLPGGAGDCCGWG